jgi:hypothetical protein
MKNPMFHKISGFRKLLNGVLISAVSAYVFLYSSAATAQGNLMLFPKRVVFNGSSKMQSVNLINTGTDTVKYVISITHLRMLEDGRVELIDTPDSAQQFADNFIRYYPRHIILPPNKAQTVKIQLINTNAMQPGEYRSHMYFRAEPDYSPLGVSDKLKDANVIGVKVNAIFGITIPLIIRIGESTTKIGFENPALEFSHDNSCKLKITVTRIGNMSVYGDLAVNYVSEQGKTVEVAVIKGMAVYTPYVKRNFEIDINQKNGVNLHTGRLHITYATQPDEKSVLLAETDVMLK